jgi:hypothetical protein
MIAARWAAWALVALAQELIDGKPDRLYLPQIRLDRDPDRARVTRGCTSRRPRNR